jgi:hypothetical protein
MLTMAKPTFAFTICETADRGKIAAKRITPTLTIQYDEVLRWRFAPAIETSLEAMAERLRALALDPRRMIVMGAPLPGLDLSRWHRRLWAEPRMATLGAPIRSWLPIDLDDVPVPKGLGAAERLAEAALFVRDRLLPHEFHGARMIVVPSASTGRKGERTARLRLFVALASPHPLRTMKDWAKGAAATLELPIDSSLIQAGQPIYTGRPIFEGVDDPVPRPLHAQVLDGDRDIVALVVDRFAPKLAAIEARIDRAVRGCGPNWRALLDITVGDDGFFFVPLTRGIGVAVRAGAHFDEIEATVTTLLALRADPGRQAQYGRPWVMRTIESFYLRDHATREAHQRALSRLFIEETRAP